jgi:succinate dehydrogenase / fumarate reductase, cytochrome b subunit
VFRGKVSSTTNQRSKHSSVAFFYHLCSGIRHLAWDAGYGFDISTTYRSGYAVIAATIVLTVLAWLYVLLA